MESPTPQQIKETRLKAGITQTEAALMTHVSLTAWQKWEAPKSASTHRPINMASWELFLIKVGFSISDIKIKGATLSDFKGSGSEYSVQVTPDKE